jgi:hypothetical protein
VLPLWRRFTLEFLWLLTLVSFYYWWTATLYGSVRRRPPHKNSTNGLHTQGSLTAQIGRTGASKEFNIFFRFLGYGGYAFSIRLNLADRYA